MKEFADDNYKFDEYGRELSNSVKNTVEKEEIARYKQLSFFCSVLSVYCKHITAKTC